MPTFLTTKKMNPALAARIEASVRGDARRASTGPSRGKRIAFGVARLALVALVLFVARSVLAVRTKAANELDEARASLLADRARKSADLGPDERALVTRVRPLLVAASAAYEGDLVDEALRGKGLDEVLSRPAVYVRGPVAAFGDEKALVEAAATSRKDPLLVCLAHPPSSRDEKTVLSDVRAVYLGGGESRTANVRHLHEAMLGLPFFEPAWETKVAAAATTAEVLAYRHAFEKAPIDAAVSAAKARVLLFAMDEPGKGDGPTEIDGERVHDVRVGIVDLALGKVLLRFKKTVDPAWISSAARVVYASGLDGCLLALDVRKAVVASAR